MADPQHNGKHGDNQAHDPQTGEVYEDFAAAPGADMRIDEAHYRKTITMASIGCMPERAKLANKTVLLCTISGIIRGTELQSLASDANKPDDQKTWFEALTGDFQAVVYTGPKGKEGDTIRYRGGFCYLPEGWHKPAVDAFKRSAQNSDEGVEQAFRFDFAAVPSGNPRGYSYMGANRMPINPALDRIAALDAYSDGLAGKIPGKAPDLLSHTQTVEA